MFYKYQSSRTADFDLIINDSIRYLEGTNRGSDSEVIIPLYLMGSFVSFPVRSNAIQWVMNSDGTLVDNNETFFVDGIGKETRTIQPARSYLFDGVDDYISVTGLLATDTFTVAIGSGNVTLSNGRIDVASESNVWDLKIFRSSVLWSHYKCDETEENPTSYDSSGNANHGTKNNVTYSTFHNEDYFFGSDYQNQVGYSVDGTLGLIPRDEKNPVLDVLGNNLEFAKRAKYNIPIKGSNCGTFGGIDDFVSIPHNDNLNFGQNDFEIEFNIEVPFTSLSNWGGIVSKGGGTSAPAERFAIAANGTTTNKISYIDSVSSGTFNINLTTSIIPNGQHNIKVTREGLTVFIFVDGILNNSEIGAAITNLVGTDDISVGQIGSVRYLLMNNFYDLSIKNNGVEVLNMPFSEGAGTKIYDVSGNNNHGDANNITESTFWGTKQDIFHYNILEGFSLYEHTTLNSIRVPYKSDGTPLTITPPSGYTKTSDNPSGNWHNNAESYLEQQKIPQIVQADEDIKYWYGTNLTKGFTASDYTGVSTVLTDSANSSILNTHDGVSGLGNAGMLKGATIVSGNEYYVRFRSKSNVAQANGFTSIGDFGSVGTATLNPNISASYQSYEFKITATQTTFRIYTTFANLGDSFDILDLQVAATSDDTANQIYYQDLQYDIYLYTPYHQIFANISIENKYKDSLTYAEEQTGTTLDKIYSFINDQVMRDSNGDPILDQDGNVIYIN